MSDQDDSKEKVKAKRSPLVIILPIVTLLIGAGGASGYFLFLAPEKDGKEDQALAEDEDPESGDGGSLFNKDGKDKHSFVKIDTITLPLIVPDGRVRNYVNFKMTLETGEDDAIYLTNNIPRIRHAIIQATSANEVSGNGHLSQLDYDKFSKLLTKAINKKMGGNYVYRVNIVSVMKN